MGGLGAGLLGFGGGMLMGSLMSHGIGSCWSPGYYGGFGGYGGGGYPGFGGGFISVCVLHTLTFAFHLVKCT